MLQFQWFVTNPRPYLMANTPLMLRISKDGKKKYQSLGISVNPKFWDFQKNKPKPKCPNLSIFKRLFLIRNWNFKRKMLEIKSDQKRILGCNSD